MVKLTFEFDEAVLKEYSMTKDELLDEVRIFANENGITESRFGVFEKDSEDALCVILDIATKIVLDNMKNIECLKKVELDVDGEIEDCIKETKEWLLEENAII